MRLLVIEDQDELGDSIKAGLGDACYVVDLARDGETGSYWARTHDYDLIILDYHLPGKNGSIICREVRVPILILSVVTDIQTKVELLNTGADDYLTKPFSFAELQARIRAMLRRRPMITDDLYCVGDLSLDTQRQSVRRGKREITLNRKEYMLLEYLVRRRGEVVSRAALLEHVWDRDADPFSNTIETHVLRLRKKIEGHGKQKLIHTVPGRGYKLDSKA